MFGLGFLRGTKKGVVAARPRRERPRRFGFEALEDRSLLSISGGSLISQTSLASVRLFTGPVETVPAAVAAKSAPQTAVVDNSATAAASAVPMFKLQSHSSGASPFAGSSTATGLTPSQIRQAYGFNQVTFSNGSIQGDGTGQTIAIVDAYNAPNIVSDLASFDQYFGIPAPPSFRVVGQNGSSTLPPTDPSGPGDSWAVEISLDVEWAHALAPGASILLVEANSSSFVDLVQAGVSYAASQPGVVVVSMSFGGGEGSFETSQDGFFRTPAGHTGVTFLAATGDDGSPGGYPAYSPNVVAVGGTYLTLNPNNSYKNETGWTGSGGGISTIEAQPSYQVGIVTQSSTRRTIPDVSFDADPNSGVPVFDSWDFGASTPWVQVGGTSFSSPSWAAIIAVTDQGRAIAGLGSLDGRTQTLPALYGLPSADFHDITTGSNGGFSAGPGYDLVTGRGSPIVNLIVPGLIGSQPTGLQSSLFSASAVPTTVDSADPQAIEVGVTFTSDVNGFITGVRFYKSDANTGVHTGSLWTAAGVLLATATFTGETTNGWQQVNFSTPVAITAGTTYVAGYHTTSGHYARTQSYFSTAYTNGPLHVPVNGGIYLYGTDRFPTTTYLGTNYWVDVVLSSTPPVDTTPPTVTGITPPGGSSSVAIATAVTVTFSEAMNASTINAGTVLLMNGASAVAATVTYNTANRTATLTPNSALTNGTTYTVRVIGGSSGVKDVAGNALATTVLSSFTTVPVQTNFSLFSSSAVPASIESGDPQAIEVGVKFSSDVSGFITGLRFYKAAANTGPHVANLWTAAGVLVATATFNAESASGWQQVNFASPVAISAGVTYIASYHTTTGHYSRNFSYFTSPYTSAPLHVPTGGGVYLYGTGGFPTNTFQGSNYWVDVAFSSVPPADTTPPTVTSITPPGGTSTVSTGTSVTVAFSEAMNAATINTGTVLLMNGASAVTASVSYDPTSHTTTLTPTSALAYSTTYTVVVAGGSGGVKDLAGNALVANVSSSFTTAAATASFSLFNGGTLPATADSGDAQAVELGVKFTSDSNGFITGLRFYKSAANTGVHTASLWTASGVLLATATFFAETGTGWQQVNFAAPVAISAGVTYVASYHTTTGHYARNSSYFASAYTSGPLHVPANGGVYLYGAGGFPTNSFQGSNYWVDVVFSTS